jgi:hypothetical protein
LVIVNSYGVARGIRTPDRRLRRPLLYPAELLQHKSAQVIITNIHAECKANFH